MSNEHEPVAWQWLSSESLLVTPHLEIRRDEVIRHNGSRATYDILHMPRDFVAIVPTRGGDELLMIRQYRPAVRRDSYEIPAGGMDDGESPKDAARRELMEETGYAAGELMDGAGYHPLAGRSNVICYVMHAPDPEHVGKPTDPNESQEVFWADAARFADLWQQGLIHAGATVTATLLGVALGWLRWDLSQVLTARRFPS